MGLPDFGGRGGSARLVETYRSSNDSTEAPTPSRNAIMRLWCIQPPTDYKPKVYDCNQPEADMICAAAAPEAFRSERREAHVRCSGMEPLLRLTKPTSTKDEYAPLGVSFETTEVRSSCDLLQKLRIYC